MTNDANLGIPAGWIGGFAGSDERFAYPTRDLGSLDMLKNMDNIALLQRQQAILWPEFSWQTQPDAGDPKRCFQMFAPDISRIGYTEQGRVYAIICPQQGIGSPSLGTINVEITVTGQRGWVDEDTRALACDMSVEVRIWFGHGHHENTVVKLLWKMIDDLGHDFPISKDKAIVVSTHKPGYPDQPIFQLSKGENPRFDAPEFARHPDEAWSVGHLEAEVGAIKQSGSPVVQEFSRLLMEVLNMNSGNMLKEGNVLTWNVWVNHPEFVDQKEWQEHAEKWRKSIDVNHNSPERWVSPPRFHDGSLIPVPKNFVALELAKIHEFKKNIKRMHA
ncbi:MAG: hypothetical protein ABF312_08995 [Candidatus Nanopelagicales bacterium]